MNRRRFENFLTKTAYCGTFLNFDAGALAERKRDKNEMEVRRLGEFATWGTCRAVGLQQRAKNALMTTVTKTQWILERKKKKADGSIPVMRQSGAF